ncbi:MAG: hypothetical protein IKB46_01670, partial [Paludibacteraceae bacterium]|nr:hypothetical protein [Paludibacteraceae bacterium]
MKTISLIVSNVNNKARNSILLDKYNLNKKNVELYLLTSIPCEIPSVKQSIVVLDEFELCDAINLLLPRLTTDYVIFVPEECYFLYDDALVDAMSLIDNNDVVCYNTRYIGDTINKFDIEYKNYVVNPALSDIILYPSAFMTFILSKKVYQSIACHGKSIYTIMANAFINAILSGYKYAFTP